MFTTPRLALGALFVMAGSLAALLATQATSAKPTADELAVQRGQKVYAQHCATCHGEGGKGDGPGGQNLPIRPQDLTEGRMLNPLPDHFLARIITEGGQAVGLSPLMPGFRVHLSENEIRDVIAFIRTLAVPAFDPEKVLPIARERRGPVQPIFFSHVIHAGSIRIDCQYCHAGARRSSAAGLPSVERCMGCHKIVAAQGNPEVQKLHAYWQRQESIPWVRVFKVPEYVYFPHKNHVQARLTCQTCHGLVEAMERVYADDAGQHIVNDLRNLVGVPTPPRPLTMGWCVECHRAANSKTLASLAWVKDPPPPGDEHPKAPLDCIACHH